MALTLISTLKYIRYIGRGVSWLYTYVPVTNVYLPFKDKNYNKLYLKIQFVPRSKRTPFRL